MPTYKEEWICDYCGEGDFSTDTGALDHEDSCYKNPNYKTTNTWDEILEALEIKDKEHIGCKVAELIHIYDIDGVLANINPTIIDRYNKSKNSIWYKILIFFNYMFLQKRFIPTQHKFKVISSRINFLRYPTIIWFLLNGILPYRYELKLLHNKDVRGDAYQLISRQHYKYDMLHKEIIKAKEAGNIIVYIEDEPSIRAFLKENLQEDYKDTFFIIDENQIIKYN